MHHLLYKSCVHSIPVHIVLNTLCRKDKDKDLHFPLSPQPNDQQHSTCCICFQISVKYFLACVDKSKLGWFHGIFRFYKMNTVITYFLSVDFHLKRVDHPVSLTLFRKSSFIFPGDHTLWAPLGNQIVIVQLTLTS